MAETEEDAMFGGRAARDYQQVLEAVRRELAPLAAQMQRVTDKVDSLSVDRVTRSDFESLQREVREQREDLDRRYYSREVVDRMARERDLAHQAIVQDVRELIVQVDKLEAANASATERMIVRFGALLAIGIALLQLLPSLAKLAN